MAVLLGAGRRNSTCEEEPGRPHLVVEARHVGQGGFLLVGGLAVNCGRDSTWKPSDPCSCHRTVYLDVAVYTSVTPVISGTPGN